MENINVYRGESAINDFLNPENHMTPLVELNAELNPFVRQNVHIFVKMQTFLPLMNVKSIPAYQMLENDTGNKNSLVESSSGNMAFSLSILGHLFGYERLKAIISHETNAEKLKMLLLAGAEIQVNH